MVFKLFRKKDPICGKRMEKNKGYFEHEKWFCSEDCIKKYEQQLQSRHRSL